MSDQLPDDVLPADVLPYLASEKLRTEAETQVKARVLARLSSSLAQPPIVPDPSGQAFAQAASSKVLLATVAFVTGTGVGVGGLLAVQRLSRPPEPLTQSVHIARAEEPTRVVPVEERPGLGGKGTDRQLTCALRVALSRDSDHRNQTRERVSVRFTQSFGTGSPAARSPG